MYSPLHDSIDFRSHEQGYFETLKANVREYACSGKIALIGDMNSRIGQRNDALQLNDLYAKYIPTINSNFEVDYQILLSERSSMDMISNASGTRLLELCNSTNLRILNGRVREDAGVGKFTFLSERGNSVIDYAIMSINLFPLISEFFVHDLFTCSSHVPIQLNLRDRYQNKSVQNETIKIKKKNVWDNEKNTDFYRQLNEQIPRLNALTEEMVNSETEVNSGIESFGDILYSHFWRKFTRSSDNPVRKYKSPWFTRECEIARQ